MDSANGSLEPVAIDSALGKEGNLLIEELAQEARIFVGLVNRLRLLPPYDPLRADLEGELYGSIAHLGTHATLLLEEIDRAMDKM
ncbi:hypothetical protein [Oceanithermus sp.]